MPSLTYAELAEALKIEPASANKLARRRRWPRVPGNDGKARVSVPEEALVRRDSPPDSPLDVPPVSPQDSHTDNLIKALEAHVETLKAQLVAAETRIDKQADDLVAYDAAYAAGLAAERAKAERAVAEFAARDAQHTAELKAEQAQTEKAIDAFRMLADRLDQLAAERARPWWRWRTGTR